MLGKDINGFFSKLSEGTESQGVYRTWIVNNAPDFEGNQYTGLKSGDSDLFDIKAYLIPDNGQILDFNLPDVQVWGTTKQTLTDSFYDSQIAIIDGYVYLFGGLGSDKILRATIENPTDWEDTGSVLPSKLGGSQLAIINNTIYLFGGCNENESSKNVIYSAPVSNPLSWIDTGYILPNSTAFAQLTIINNYIYLIGGKNGVDVSSSILKAPTSNPLSWTDTNSNIPAPLYGSQLCVYDGYVYLIGGLSPEMSDKIYKVESSNIEISDEWNIANVLPRPTAFGQVVIIGKSVYYIGGYGNSYSVWEVRTSDPPLCFVDRGTKLPAPINRSQLMIVYDKLFLLGGNGSSIIFSSGNKNKYDINNQNVIDYGNITRTQYDAASTLDLFNVLGFRPWITDYGSY